LGKLLNENWYIIATKTVLGMKWLWHETEEIVVPLGGQVGDGSI